MYAGPVSVHCADHLRRGGLLLANDSHADAVLAASDPRFSLVAVLHRSGDRYRVERTGLDRFLVPRAGTLDRERLLRDGRGVAYTHPADAYVLRRVDGS